MKQINRNAIVKHSYFLNFNPAAYERQKDVAWMLR